MAVLAIAMPSAALAGPADDEYQLDIPKPGKDGGHGGSGDGGDGGSSGSSYPAGTYTFGEPGSDAGGDAAAGSGDYGAGAGGSLDGGDDGDDKGSKPLAEVGSKEGKSVPLSDALAAAAGSGGAGDGSSSVLTAAADALTDEGMPLLLIGLGAVALGAAVLARRRASGG